MPDVITLADPATNCDWAANSGMRAEALASTLAIELTSSCTTETFGNNTGET